MHNQNKVYLCVTKANKMKQVKMIKKTNVVDILKHNWTTGEKMINDNSIDSISFYAHLRHNKAQKIHDESETGGFTIWIVTK